MALVCKGFLFVPLVDSNCPGSDSDRRENVKKTQRESSKVLNIMPRWWSHGSNDLRGVFGLVQIHRTGSCQRYFKWAKNICKHTHPKTHAAYSCKHTSCISRKLTYAPHRKCGVCSHSQPVIAIYHTAPVPQHTAQMWMSSSACNLCCVIQLSPV